MVVPLFNPMPAIVAATGNVTQNLNTVSDRVIQVGKNTKDGAQHTKGIATFMKFTPIIGLMTALLGILSKPLEFIVMIIGGLFLAVIYVIYKIFAFPPLVWVVFAIWFLIMKVVLLIIYTIVIGVVVVFICFILMIIAFINYIFKGALNKLVLCQNSPLAWYQIPNYHLGNKFERSLFCKSTCASGFRPDELTGEFCNRLPKGQPSYCPQAEVMRLFSNYSRYDMKYKYDNYDATTNFSFNMMSPQEKEVEYKKHFLNRQQYLNKCKQSLGNYNPMTIDICSSLDMLKKQGFNGLSERDIARMKAVCHQGFCNSRSRYAFCGTFGQSDKEGSSTNELIKLFAWLLILCVIFMFILYFTYQIVQEI